VQGYYEKEIKDYSKSHYGTKDLTRVFTLYTYTYIYMHDRRAYIIYRYIIIYDI